ncbi:thermonuclease family protein [Hyphomicrobium sp.]|jgi:endonuclease YncB( thermonuclease family)|uniref:thermonuclease family protein n=1 Tax=Hyphomicrobium sp. TaxID=82 RepID=UPI002CB42B0C|nr:thermonuclease family protein [Hyphomicrobium sp.]HVZ06064.1 thermonuclease family protein [Hyphomicrobium sp.]
MKPVAFVLSAKLSRIGRKAGAFFALAIFSQLPAIAFAVTGPERDQPAIIEGSGRVVDGDTLDVGATRIRLEGIDAPEMAQTCETATGKTWACGKVSAAFLRSLVQQRDIACDRTGTDRYRRVLANCFEDGTSVNEAMVRAGMAWAFVRYSREYVTVEADARARKVGVWQGPAEAPWDFRHNKWQLARTTATPGCVIKGNISSHGHIYHMPWSPWYDRVKIDEARGERWFCSEADALAAGWRPAAAN